MGHKYTPQERIELVDNVLVQVRSGSTVEKASRKIGIASSQFYAWKKLPRVSKEQRDAVATLDTQGSVESSDFRMEVPIPSHILQKAVKQYLAQKLDLN